MHLKEIPCAFPMFFTSNSSSSPSSGGSAEGLWWSGLSLLCVCETLDQVMSGRRPQALMRTPRVLLYGLTWISAVSHWCLEMILLVINDILSLVIRRWHWPSDDVTVKRSKPRSLTRNCSFTNIHMQDKRQYFMAFVGLNELVWLKVQTSTSSAQSATLHMLRVQHPVRVQYSCFFVWNPCFLAVMLLPNIIIYIYISFCYLFMT